MNGIIAILVGAFIVFLIGVPICGVFAAASITLGALLGVTLMFLFFIPIYTTYLRDRR